MGRIVIALLLWTSPTSPERIEEVVEIGEAVEIAAEASGYDEWRLAALVIRESGVRCDRVGKLGERGPAQVIPYYVGMTADEIATPEGGMLGAIRALDRWKAARPDADPWQCYASGNRCTARRSMRRLRRIEARLRALHDAHVAASAVVRRVDSPWAEM